MSINNSYIWKEDTILHSKQEEYFCCSPKKGKTVCKECNLEKPIYSKFVCVCEPLFCESCIETIKNCPSCNSNKYCILSEDQIELMLRKKLDPKTIFKIFCKFVITNKITGPFSLKNLVAKSETITKVYSKLDKLITLNYEDKNNIFSFAADLWNIPEKINNEPNTAYCYKTMSISYFGDGYYKFCKNRWNCASVDLSMYELNVT